MPGFEQERGAPGGEWYASRIAAPRPWRGRDPPLSRKI
jgi:hypothetical protein